MINIFGLALGLIGSQQIMISRFTGRTLNGTGDYVNTYAAAVEEVASVQPLSANVYKELGLDMSKNYVAVYCSESIDTAKKDRAGDLVETDGKTYRAEQLVNWLTFGGYVAVVCVEV
jgi:hypothetical protein